MDAVFARSASTLINSLKNCVSFSNFSIGSFLLFVSVKTKNKKPPEAFSSLGRLDPLKISLSDGRDYPHITDLGFPWAALHREPCPCSFTPCEFIAAITQHIPDKSFQLVRYYGWYSNKMRGQRDKQAAAAAVQPDGKAAAVIDVSEHKPRRIPSKKWRELIKKVWEADPLLCPRCQKEMRIVALIDDKAVIERILRHLGLWQQGVRVAPGTDPPADWVIEPCFDLSAVVEAEADDALPDYDTVPDLAYANE